MSPISRLLSLFTIVAFFATSAFGQVQTGTPPFGSFAGGPDTINLATLNTSIGIPILHKAGRGTSFGYGLSYNSSIWYPASAKWQATTTWGFAQGNPMGYVTYTQAGGPEIVSVHFWLALENTEGAPR